MKICDTMYLECSASCVEHNKLGLFFFVFYLICYDFYNISAGLDK